MTPGAQPAATRVDTHVHVFDYAGPRDPRVARHVFSADRREPIEQFRQDMVEADISHAVLIALPGQVDYVLAAARADREHLTAVLTLECADDWSMADDAVWWDPLVRGIRVTSLAEAERLAGSPQGLLDRVRKLGERGMILSTFVRASEFPALLELVSTVPETPVVLNHCGFPLTEHERAVDGVPQAVVSRMAHSVAAFAELQHVCVCLSGAYAYTARPYPYPDVQEWAATLLADFGPYRVVLGSDSPWIREDPGYEATLDCFDSLLDDLTVAERRAIEADNALRLYFAQ